MTAVDRIAEVLAEHELISRTCRCGWRATPLALRWWEAHFRHQAEVIAGLDGLAVVEAESSHVQWARRFNDEPFRPSADEVETAKTTLMRRTVIRTPWEPVTEVDQ